MFFLKSNQEMRHFDTTRCHTRIATYGDINVGFNLSIVFNWSEFCLTIIKITLKQYLLRLLFTLRRVE